MREKRVPINREHSELQMFQMQTFICITLLLLSVATSSGVENVIAPAELIADVYQQLHCSCILMIESHAQHQGEIKPDNIFCEECMV
jgi:hypothetical protein